MFTIFAGLSQFEADLTAQRTREGLEAARLRGRLGGRPKTDESNVKQALKLYGSKEYTVKEIEELTGVKKSTLYRNKEFDHNAKTCKESVELFDSGSALTFW